jgi:agmatinase
MPLRSAPLPRMAGHLPFMRTPTQRIEDLTPGVIAALGAPFGLEASSQGVGFGPLALRETSAYFGSHFSSNMAAAMDVDRRRVLDTAAIAGRLVDLGDLDPDGEDRDGLLALTSGAVTQVANRGAIPLVLGGDAGLIAPILAGLAAATGRGVALLQIGGAPVAHDGVACVHLLTTGDRRKSRSDLERCADPASLAPALTALFADTPLHVALDAAAFDSIRHGAAGTVSFAGFGLAQCRALFSGLGGLEVAGLSVTGLEPTRNGLSTVKTGQRLLLTAILELIYAQLGVLAEPSETRHA